MDKLQWRFFRDWGQMCNSSVTLNEYTSSDQVGVTSSMLAFSKMCATSWREGEEMAVMELPKALSQIV